MLWFLHPEMQECVLIENQMQRLESLAEIKNIRQFADSVKADFPFFH